MALAPLMIVFISMVFAVGAVAALIWFFIAGQWSDTSTAASLVLDDREPIGWEDMHRTTK
jgi:nitrogen fixation-related uncharacterized protein